MPARCRRTEILKAAQDLFFERGYRGTTIQQVASAAGYSKRTVYLDFASKDDLFLTLCAEGGDILLEKLRGVPADELPVRECLEHFLEVYVDFSRRHREYFRMVFSEATPEIIANATEPARARLEQLERDCIAVLVAWAERGIREGLMPPVDPQEVAGIVTGTATGIILLSMGGSQTIFTQRTLESLARQAIRLFWAGLRSLEA